MKLDGQLQEIIYQNETNSYTIATFTTEEEEFTVVGYLPFINEGDFLELDGKFVTHQDYGRQFKIDTFEKKMPEGKEALEKYLASGIIKGVGPSTARKIVERFGEETLAIFKFEPEKLSEIKGISVSGAKEMAEEFNQKWNLWQIVGFLEKFGITIEEENYQFHETCKKEHTDCLGVKFNVKPQKYTASDYIVEGDYSSASYLLAATAIAGGYVRVENLFSDSKQGDKFILDVLEDMGANVTVFDDYVSLRSDGNLKGIDVNLANAPDLLLTVAVLGAVAEGKTTITGVSHGRLKETDRIDTTCRELEKLGCKLEEFEDGMTIYGQTIGDGVVESHNDHRLAMAFSLLGLKYDVEVENGECFDVSFPNFIEIMGEIGIEMELK